MNQRGIIHPDMLARVQPNFYPSMCTIRAATITRDAYGQPQQTWHDLAGHTNLHCRIAPRSTQERMSPAQVYVVATHHIALGGYYPTIDETMQVIAEGIVYEIEGVEWDGNRKMTRLFARLVE